MGNRHEPKPLNKAVCRVAYAARKGKRVNLSDWKDVVKACRLTSERPVASPAATVAQEAVVSEAKTQYIAVQVATPCNAKASCEKERQWQVGAEGGQWQQETGEVLLTNAISYHAGHSPHGQNG